MLRASAKRGAYVPGDWSAANVFEQVPRASSEDAFQTESSCFRLNKKKAWFIFTEKTAHLKISWAQMKKAEIKNIQSFLLQEGQLV
jgi:hypothetical protein